MNDEMNELYDSGNINLPGIGSMRMMAYGVGDFEGLGEALEEMTEELQAEFERQYGPIAEYAELVNSPIMKNWAMSEYLRIELGNGQNITINNPRDGKAKTAYKNGKPTHTTWTMPATLTWHMPIFGDVQAEGKVVTTIFHREGRQVAVDNDIRATFTINGSASRIWIDAGGNADIQMVKDTCEVSGRQECSKGPFSDSHLEVDGYVSADISVDGPPYHDLNEEAIYVA